MDRKYNDTTCLLKFLVDPQGYSGEANGLLALYAGDATIGETIGESIVAHVINSSVSYHYYLSHPWKNSARSLGDGTSIISLKPSNAAFENVVKPFSESKFSEISRAYVNKFFQEVRPDNTVSTNWMILTKDPRLKKIWEDKINPTGHYLAYVRIPDHMESNPKLDPKRELFHL